MYRAPRQLERDDYIRSWWDPKEQGPARRVHTLTETGSDTLKMWTAAFEHDAFFGLYSGASTKERSEPKGVGSIPCVIAGEQGQSVGCLP